MPSLLLALAGTYIDGACQRAARCLMQRRLGPVHAALRCAHRREPLPPAHCAAAATAELPRVVVIGTGGTIAGEQQKPGTLGGYKPGVRAVSSLVSALPAEELAGLDGGGAVIPPPPRSPLCREPRWVAADEHRE